MFKTNHFFFVYFKSRNFLNSTYPSNGDGSAAAAVAARQNAADETSTGAESMPMRLTAVIMF